MSYIRSTSNPEGLYIYGTGRGRVEVSSRGGFRSIPRHVFVGLLKRWEERGDYNVHYRGGSLTEFWDEGFLKWSLRYNGWGAPVVMFHVTLAYIARQV